METRWRELEIGGPNGIWTISKEDGRVELRKQALDMLGIRTERPMEIREFLDYIDAANRDKIAAELTRRTKGEFLVRFQTSDETSNHHFEMRGGPTKGGMGGFICDVTETVRAEARSRRAELLARTAVEAYPGPFAAWDARQRLLFWNSAFVRMFDLPTDLLRVGVSYDVVMAEALKQVRVERPIPNSNGGRELLLLSDVWFQFQDRPMANGGTISVGLDISALKEHEEQLAGSEKKLKRLVTELDRSQSQAEMLAMRLSEQKTKAERASRSKSVFLANMSHELRTPLNAINGFSEMLINEVYGPLGDERYSGYAEDILRSGQHLLDMINDILDMAKIEAGKMSINTASIDPVEAVDAAVRMIRRRAADKSVDLDMQIIGKVPEIQGDHRAIKQMVLNLVSNSIKFTDTGGRIQVIVRSERDQVIVSVEDTGIGIPAEDLSRLAEPFEQSNNDDGRNSQGTGLGLALTKSFAEMHGGRLLLESEVGKGTTVTFFLPIAGPGQKTATRSVVS